MPTTLSPTSELLRLIHDQDWTGVRRLSATFPAPEIADLVAELERTAETPVLRTLSHEKRADVFSYLPPETQEALLSDLTDDEKRQLLADLSPDDRTHLLGFLSGQKALDAMKLLAPDDLAESRRLLGYPENSVGRLMTPDVVTLYPDWSVAEALDHIRVHGADSETINRCYVVGIDGKLLDDVSLGSLVLASPQTRVRDLIDGHVMSIDASADRNEAVRLIQRYDLDTLPVVGPEGVLLGIVTVDDVLDVAEEEATEDFHKAGSVGPLHTSLRSATVPYLYRRRVGWLLALVGMNIFSGAGIAYFEETIAATVALVFFLPLLIDSAGNAGSQSATLMIRALATGDVGAKDWFTLLRKEVLVSGAMAFTMAAAVSILGAWRGGQDVAVVVCLTMLVLVTLGSLVGMSLPFVLSRARFDPAAASAPLVTSIADISGVLVYFSIASWYLGGR